MMAPSDPTAVEILEAMDRLQRDPAQRRALERTSDLSVALTRDGCIAAGHMGSLAECLQELHDERLIDFRTVNAGIVTPPVWDGDAILHFNRWRVTSAGRADAALHRAEQERIAKSLTAAKPSAGEDAHAGGDDAVTDDVFISHAGQDKATVARPLAHALTARGWNVWLDELNLTVGDSLSAQIDAALARSRFGVVVLSPSFFDRPWPMRELAALVSRETERGEKVILPVWHEVDQAYLNTKSPTLADRFGVDTARGVDAVADELDRALRAAHLRPAAARGRETVVQAMPAPAPSSASPAAPTSPGLPRDQIPPGDLLATEIDLRESADHGDRVAQIRLADLAADRGRDAEARDLRLDVAARGAPRPAAARQSSATLWVVVGGATPVPATADHQRFELVFGRGDDRRQVFLEITGTAAACEPSTLPPAVAEAIATRGLSVAPLLLDRVEPPAKIVVSSTTITIVPREGAYEPGDRVVVREGDGWVGAEFVRPGASGETTTVYNPSVEGGSLARDQALVRRDDGTLKFYTYENVRAEPPPRG
jgi:hypothetical protein